MELFNPFKDTIFLKETSDMQERFNALERLIKEYPNNEKLKEEYFITKQGLYGENEIAYQLKKSNLGLYVLRDINIEYEDLKAQIDYVVITKAYTYFIECKNLYGNITVDNKGDFIREYSYNGKKIRKGIYSPLRQVEAQRDVFKKIWNISLSKNKIINGIKRFFSEDNFTDLYHILVVAANHETILNMKYAPSYMKYKVLKAEQLVRQLEYELSKIKEDERDNKNEMEKEAKFFLSINKENNNDYYEYYKNKCINQQTKPINKDKLKDKLLEFRKKRSNSMNIPAYYVFTNDELDKLIEMQPTSIEELKQCKILSTIKVKTHGELIIEIIKNIRN